MPWSKNRPGGNKVNPKYRTKEHLAQCAAYKQQLERDGFLTCAEARCIKPSRIILPGMAWAAGHDSTGTRYVGPVHRACNSSDAGRRARARQASSSLRW